MLDSFVDSNVENDQDKKRTQNLNNQIHPQNVDPDVEPIQSERSGFLKEQKKWLFFSLSVTKKYEIEATLGSKGATAAAAGWPCSCTI